MKNEITLKAFFLSIFLIWLFFKLPILIIIGYCLFPLVESKIFKDDVVTLYYGTVTIAAPIIIDLQPEENIIVCENDSFSIFFETFKLL